MRANIPVVSIKLISIFNTLAMISQWLNQGDHHKCRADIAALNTKDTISKKPMPNIMPNDNSLVRNNAHTPVCACAGTRQIRSRACCNSAKTLLAPSNSVTLQNMLILGIVVSLFDYYFALQWGKRLLDDNDIELPKFTRWLVLNTFAFIVSSVIALPFPSII